MAAQQALLQFANFLPMMAVEDSAQAAKENAVFNLIYINLVRMVYAQMIQATDRPLLSLEFFNKMAQIDTEKDMEEFVKSEFVPLVRSPKNLGTPMPKFSRSYDAISNLMKHLYKQLKVKTWNSFYKVLKIYC